MFDVNAKDGTVRKTAYKSPIPAGGGEGKQEKPARGLDSPAMVDLHCRLLDFYQHELERQADNRLDMARDADFYDNIQWDAEDAQTLRDRGQVPLVYNVLSASVDWVLGTEKRTRTDAQVLPRRKEFGEPAKKKSELLKYLSDVNRTPFCTSRAFEDAVKIGVGWLEDGIQDGDEDEPLYTRYESWRNLVWDSMATEPDLADGRYVFRTKWADLDIAQSMFKRRTELLERSAANADQFLSTDSYADEPMDQPELELEMVRGLLPSENVAGYMRRRVRLIEGWTRIPVSVDVMVGGQFRGEIYDANSPGHAGELAAENAITRKKTVMRMHVSIFTPDGMLWHSPSPFRHNRFPFTPIWGHRRDRDNMPYGMIRRLRDIQVDVNKRASKALHVFSTNKVIMDEGAVDDVDEFREEVARPDALIVKKTGKELVLNADREVGQWHLELMSRDIAMIQQAGGVTDEQMGRTTNARSGIAIARRQEQGSMTTAKYFDNLLYSKQVAGEKRLANVEQYMTEEKQFRITNQRGKPEWITVNDGLPTNAIALSKADYVIDQSAWHATMRQAAVEQLMEVMARFPPEIIMLMLDLVVENMDLPNREEIVKRIRAASGQRDPDAETPTPEEQAQAEATQKRNELEMAGIMANLRKLFAEAEKTAAQADQIRAQTVGAKVSAQQSAMVTAREAIAVPAATHVADHILGESGFVAASDQTASNRAVGLAQPMPAPQPQPPEPVGTM